MVMKETRIPISISPLMRGIFLPSLITSGYDNFGEKLKKKKHKSEIGNYFLHNYSYFFTPVGSGMFQGCKKTYFMIECAI